MTEIVSNDSEASWTVKEAAAFLGISSKTLYRWAAAGQVPHMKLGGALRFSRAALQAWRAKHTHGGEA